MGKEHFQSYKSNKILGKLYRQIKDGHDLDETASSDLTFAPGDIPYDVDLENSESSNFIADAWGAQVFLRWAGEWSSWAI